MTTKSTSRIRSIEFYKLLEQEVYKTEINNNYRLIGMRPADSKSVFIRHFWGELEEGNALRVVQELTAAYTEGDIDYTLLARLLHSETAEALDEENFWALARLTMQVVKNLDDTGAKELSSALLPYTAHTTVFWYRLEEYMDSPLWDVYFSDRENNTRALIQAMLGVHFCQLDYAFTQLIAQSRLSLKSLFFYYALTSSAFSDESDEELLTLLEHYFTIFDGPSLNAATLILKDNAKLELSVAERLELVDNILH